MSMVKQRQENLWQLARMYKVAREAAAAQRALLIEALSVQQRKAYEEAKQHPVMFSWMLADNMEISQSAASDLLRALYEVGLIERGERNETGGFGYVVSCG